MKFKHCSFQTVQTTSFSGFTNEELVMAFKDLRNLHLISYDDGLIDNGKFIVLFNMTCVPFWRHSLRRAAFVLF